MKEPGWEGLHVTPAMAQVVLTKLIEELTVLYRAGKTDAEVLMLGLFAAYNMGARSEAQLTKKKTTKA